jgi:hypothetical protein
MVASRKDNPLSSRFSFFFSVKGKFGGPAPCYQQLSLVLNSDIRKIFVRVNLSGEQASDLSSAYVLLLMRTQESTSSFGAFPRKRCKMQIIDDRITGRNSRMVPLEFTIQVPIQNLRFRSLDSRNPCQSRANRITFAKQHHRSRSLLETIGRLEARPARRTTLKNAWPALPCALSSLISHGESSSSATRIYLAARLASTVSARLSA